MWIPLLGLAQAAPPDRAPVDDVLAALHRAATEADADAYFSLFAPDAVFIGTDAAERWDLDAFRAFAMPHFAEAPAWDYTPVQRHVSFDRRGRTAWFDESLDHARYGRVRGSGVLQRDGSDWRIAQYVLSFAIPNDVAADVIAVVQGGGATLPPMFTADQIRDAMPEGLVLTFEQSTEGGTPVPDVWRVAASTPDGMQLASPEGSPGPVLHWDMLRDHARFAASGTTVDDVPLSLPLGEVSTRRYRVARGDEVHTFWFAPKWPGPPVQHVVAAADGTILSEQRLVARSVP